MGEKVTISYRGATYELGRGKRCYGIWTAGVPRSEPVERWPETPEGWAAAWTRFTAMETPGTIAPVGKQQVPSQAGPAGPGPGAFAASGDTVAFGQAFEQTGTAGRFALGSAGNAFAGALLALGVICGVVGLFPHYQVGVSLAAQASELVPHVAYLAVWTVAALLIVLRSGVLARAGALLAVGTTVVTFGLFAFDLGQGTSVADAGLWISLVGWLACAAGTAVAFRATRVLGEGSLGRPGGRGIARAALLIAAGIGVAVTFFPNWDSYLLNAQAIGKSQEQALGNAFASTAPGWGQAADAVVMVLFVLVVIAAALWRPLVAGAMLLAGAVIPMGAQALSGMIAATEPTSPASFGYSASDAQQLGLTITNGLTPAFWIYCLFIIILLVSCAWMFIAPPERLVAGPAPEPADEQVDPVLAGPDVADPVLAEPVTEPVAGQLGDAWTERELAADSGDERA
jgi:hypothetical protein